MEEQQIEGEEGGSNMLTFPINNLPIDIIANILARFPVKPLLRLKIICKSWLALISTAHFADLHLRHHALSSDRLLIASDKSSSLYSINIDLPDSSAAVVKLHIPIQLPFENTRITGSCNGILCLRDSLTSEKKSIVLLNPCTKEYKVVGDCGPSYSSHVGLGFDFGENEYKLVQLSCRYKILGPNGIGNSWKTRVYSLKTNCWRLIEDDGFRNFNLVWHTCPALIQNHLLHWIFSSMSPSHLPDKIGCFDVCDERWKAVALPTFADDEPQGGSHRVNRPKLISLVVLDECLCLVTNNPVRSDFYDVWIMKEYGVAESWVRLLGVSDSPATIYRTCKPVAWSKDEREHLLVENQSPMGSHVFWYDVRRKVAMEVDFDWSLDYETLILFRESLAKIDAE